MNEYEYLFTQDCREKKRTASGDNKDTLADDLRRALTFVLPDHKTYKITIETI